MCPDLVDVGDVVVGGCYGEERGRHRLGKGKILIASGAPVTERGLKGWTYIAALVRDILSSP